MKCPVPSFSQTSGVVAVTSSEVLGALLDSAPDDRVPRLRDATLLVPGERFNRKIVDYLRFTREFNARFPGFDTDVHGLVADEAGAYYVDCVKP